jgi:hypothetical protein
MHFYQTDDFPQLMITEAFVRRQSYRVEPKLGNGLLLHHMDMQWLIEISHYEEKAIPFLTKYGRHRSLLPTSQENAYSFPEPW